MKSIATGAFSFVVAVLSAVTGPLSGCARYHVYWGDVHGHTNISDGSTDLEAFLTYARDVARLDFVIVTDHDFGNGPPWRMGQDTWRRIQETVDAYTVDGAFVAIAGYEWTSQPKYWSESVGDEPSEMLFDGPPKYYNHKNVYFPSKVADIFRSKDAAYNSPDLLAAAVLAHGGLIHNNHPTAGPDGRDQWDYHGRYFRVVANTEMLPDTVWHDGTEYTPRTEQTVRAFLNSGGRTGFVGGSDSHDGRPQARTAVLARELSRPAIFEALRNRRNYAVYGHRILLAFSINGHGMGQEIETTASPRLTVTVAGTDKIDEVAIVRDGRVLYSVAPSKKRVRLDYVDSSLRGPSYYYIRVTQANTDEHGNPSRAWSSPIWVNKG